MIIVADASPLIFLAKLGHLDLIWHLPDADIHLSALVREETLNPKMADAERQELNDFFAHCHLHPSQQTHSFATAMSLADNDTLALAIRLRAGRVLADDRILRATAEAKGIRPLGTLGLLLAAMRKGALTQPETRRLLDALVGLHDFRIGIAVYQAVLAQIDRHGE